MKSKLKELMDRVENEMKTHISPKLKRLVEKLEDLSLEVNAQNILTYGDQKLLLEYVSEENRKDSEEFEIEI